MIHEYYPSEKRKEALKPPVVVNHPARHSTHTELTSNYRNYGVATVKAAKLGLSLTEYLRRKDLVQAESNACSYQTGDTVYPTLAKELKKYGKCLVRSICRDFDLYGTVEWHEPPFIVQFSPLNDMDVTINCTVNFLAKRVDETEGNNNVC